MRGLTVFSNRSSSVINRVAVFGINEDLLGVVAARLELGHVFHAVDSVSRSSRDSSDASEVLLGIRSVLNELVSPRQRAIHRSGRVY